METTLRSPVRMEAPVTGRGDWPVDPDVTFLNHGSYGLCPRPVLEAQSRHRAQMERDPVCWFMRDMEPLLDEARRALGGLINARPQDIGWTANATVAIATVLQNIDWREGDEILACDQEYMSAINEVRRLEARRGVKLVCPPLRLPIASEEEIVETLMAAVTDRTRLAILSHITSPSAFILPVAELTRRLRRRGVEVLVDGAHAPGQIPVDLKAIDPDYYVATLHKWVCAPKGAGMLWVSEARQSRLRPIALSSRASEDKPWRPLFLRDFDYHGTDDYTPHICVKEAVAFMGSLLPAGFEGLMRRNHEMVVRAREILCDALDLEPPTPPRLLGMMATVILPPVPERLQGQRTVFGDPIQDRLVHDHRIQVPIWTNPLTGRRFCRISAQVYNRLDEYERLAEALREELAREQT